MIRVFAGCSDGLDTESQAVLEYSLRAHASEPIELTWLRPTPEWNSRDWSTPFSGQRWSVPALCGFEGRAIYLDSDMIPMADIAELWEQDIPRGAIALVTGQGRKQRTCCMVLDCAAAGRWLPPLEVIKRTANGRRYNEALAADPAFYGQIDGRWNVVDLKGSSLDDPALKLIHYSSIAHQPHLERAVARLAAQGQCHWYDGERFAHWRPELVTLFDQLLDEATAAGYGPERYAVAKPYSPPMRSYRNVRVKGYSQW